MRVTSVIYVWVLFIPILRKHNLTSIGVLLSNFLGANQIGYHIRLTQQKHTFTG